MKREYPIGADWETPKTIFTFALDANRKKVNTTHFYLPPSGVGLPVKKPIAHPGCQV
jgi:hypothetical protein